MKSIQIALILALLLPGSHALADPRPSGHSGTSSSYKSGFSSQKSKPAPAPRGRESGGQSGTAQKNSNGGNGSFGSFGARQKQAAPPPSGDSAAAQPRGGFGTFGQGQQRDGAPGAGAPRRSDSAMARDLERSRANANAMKTLDERRAAANAPPPLPPLNDTLAPTRQPYGRQQPYERSADSQRQQPYDRSSDYRQQQPYDRPPAAQQNNGGGLGGLITGAILGRAVSGSGGQVTGGSNGNLNNGSLNGGVLAPAPTQQPSFGGSFLRTFVWLALLGGAAWLVYFVIRFMRRAKARSAANYTFERD